MTFGFLGQIVLPSSQKPHSRTVLVPDGFYFDFEVINVLSEKRPSL